MHQFAVQPPPPPPPLKPKVAQAPDAYAASSGCRKWSDLTPSAQAHIMQSWMGEPWKKLADFCLHYSLDYDSIHTAFSHPDRQLIKLKKEATQAGVNPDVLGDFINSTAKSALNYDRLVNLVLHAILQQVLEGGLPLKQLMELSQRLSADRVKYGDHLLLAAQVGGGSQQGPGHSPGALSAMPPDLKKKVGQRLSRAGAALVKMNEGKTHG